LNSFSDPTEDSFIQSLQGSAKRLNGKPVNKKDHPALPAHAKVLPL
jgi:hypothetical protein